MFFIGRRRVDGASRRRVDGVKPGPVRAWRTRSPPRSAAPAAGMESHLPCQPESARRRAAGLRLPVADQRVLDEVETSFAAQDRCARGRH